ncbi:MAG: transpeptidase family protein [Acidobacteriia bacterium]|nr:transpeptidase family protein [Terriglobia bacterium]
MVERRLTWLAGIVLLWGAAIFLQLVSLQVFHHQHYLNLAKARQEVVIGIPAPRGSILDRSGAPLAMSVPTESVYVNPLKVPDLDVASDMLARVLHMDRVELYGKMKLARDNHRGFFPVKRKIALEEGQLLRDLRLDWVDIETETQRRYPKGTLAAHVLGGVDFEEKGNAGIEKFMDADLRGQAGQARLLTDVKRRGIDQQSATEARAGTCITLTIDERLQFVAERELAAAVAAHHAVSGSVVVMNPSNGEILALASYPTYDPNQPPEPAANLAARQNHAIGVPFEPGSVFKVITLSAALETTALRPESLINCHGGVLKLPGRVIHDSHLGTGILPMAMVLAKSSNIGAIQVGMQVGKDNMDRYVRKFGFAQKTGVQLPGESRGRLRATNYWGTTSLASISMGQEVSVTTVQLAQAASVIANGGMLVRPRLVLKKGDDALPQEPPVRVIGAETAITMRQMMEGVVLHGTGTAARLVGYTVGGKTGSAQIFDYASRHYTHTYNGSFVGFSPLVNPAIVVVVTLNGTHGTAGFGGAAAAPVFRVIAAEALRILDVPRDLPDEPMPKTLSAKNLNDLAIADIGSDQPNILEDSEDEGQPAAPAVSGPTIPNFRGMTIRAVLAEAAAKGLTVLPDGSGVASRQDPPAGSAMHQGERIRVKFSR